MAARKTPSPAGDSAPWHPADYEIADAAAIQALAAGMADADQQRRAVRWLIESACGTYDLSFRPAGDRETAFAEGKRFIGLTLVKLIKLNLPLLRRKDSEQA